MSDPNDPAFPGMVETEVFNDDHNRYQERLIPMGGLTKREFLAGLVMPALLSGKLPSDMTAEVLLKVCSKSAVQCADALLAELAVKKEAG